MSRPNPTGHPARYSEAIVDQLADILLSQFPEWPGRPLVVDPFAGTGEALADLKALLVERDHPYHFGFDVLGIELEAPYIVETSLVQQGDATDAELFRRISVNHATGELVIATSPVYPNGVADSFVPKDESRRFTYISSLIRRTDNAEYRLHPNNMGSYGYRGTKRGGISKRRAAYWLLALDAVRIWAKYANLVLLNVSDFKHGGGEIEPVVHDWRVLLDAHGFTEQIEVPVATPRMRNGANAEERVSTEVIVVARRG